MVRTELCEIISNGENSGIEFKRDDIRPEQLLHIDVMPVPGTTISNIDIDRVHFYLRNIIKDPEIPQSESEWITRLSGLGFMAEDGLGNTVCSVAGMICFGFNPRRILKQTGIRLLSFTGTEMEYRSQIDKYLDGPLVARWRMSESGSRELVDFGLVEKLAESIEPFISQESDTINAQMQRPKEWFYPWETIREIVVNALVHRDWTRNECVEICNYGNRIEIKSPGSLRNSMTIQKMIAGQHSPRNPLVVEIMRDFNYVDSRGMGIRTKVIPLMRAQNGVDPIFEATDDYLKVTLLRKNAIL